MSYVGQTVAGAGDINRDSFDDVLIGAPQALRVGVYLGGVTGLNTTAAVLSPTGSSARGFGQAITRADRPRFMRPSPTRQEYGRAARVRRIPVASGLSD